MEFFNKKEEVIEIKLTQFGKKKYANGNFRPKFYAFFDDDIIYDSSWGSTSEQAHSASVRIKDAPRMKIQSAHIGIETDINKKIDKIRRTNGNLTPENIQQVKEKSYSLVNALGKSDTTRDFAPSWDVRSYFSKIETSTRAIEDTGNMNYIQIPQINIQNLNYKIKSVSKPDFNANVYGRIYEDGTALTIDESDGEILLKIEEINSPLSNDKFEIEVFMVNEENGKENLVPLRFKKRRETIVNDVLLDDIVEIEEEIDGTYVENYFSIESDTQIDVDFLRRALGTSSTMTGMDEIRTFGLSGQFLKEEESSAYGIVGSQLAADLNPDQIARLSGKSLKDLGTNEEQTSAENISESTYNKIPANETSDACEEEEE